ncbi:MAG: hypothetical protein SXA11_13100 [Cyanobacteriota bacterium]|nr:hypothetical protein [Cyanobacteriota bacterium]
MPAVSCWESFKVDILPGDRYNLVGSIGGMKKARELDAFPVEEASCLLSG